MKVFYSKHLPLNLSFFVNYLTNNLILPGIIFFLVNKSITSGEALFLGSLKFWSYTAFTFICARIVEKYNIKYCIVMSLCIKAFSFSFLLFDSSFIFCCCSIFFNGFGAALFTFSSKYYLKLVSDNISESLSARYIIQNVGASIAPMVISLYLFYKVPFNFFVSTIIVAFIVGVLVTLKIPQTSRSYIDHAETSTPMKKMNVTLFIFVAVISTVFAMLYYLFETFLPLHLKALGRESLFTPIMLFNTFAIIILQVKLYKIISHRFGHITSLLIAVFICCVASGAILLGNNSTLAIVLLVLGVTYLEIFYSTGIDTIIALKSDGRETLMLFTASSLFLSIGTSLCGGLFYIKPSLVLLVTTIMLLIMVIVLKYKKI